MLTYKFSKREKALILGLALLVVFIVWFMFVYQGTTNRITELEGQISATQTQISSAETRVAQQAHMQSVIDQRKAEGAQPMQMPDYDNMEYLMRELNRIMAAANNYSLSFDQLTKDEQGHIVRGARINYETTTYDEAEAIVKSLTQCIYPCRIDSLSMTTYYEGVDILLGKKGTAKISGTVHVTFFENDTSAEGA